MDFFSAFFLFWSYPTIITCKRQCTLFAQPIRNTSAWSSGSSVCLIVGRPGLKVRPRYFKKMVFTASQQVQSSCSSLFNPSEVSVFLGWHEWLGLSMSNFTDTKQPSLLCFKFYTLPLWLQIFYSWSCSHFYTNFYCVSFHYCRLWCRIPVRLQLWLWLALKLFLLLFCWNTVNTSPLYLFVLKNCD